jgi:DUF917 family protein
LTPLFTPLQLEVNPGKLLYTGKIIDVCRNVSRGYTMGHCVIAPLTIDEMEQPTNSRPSADTRQLIIPFQNEFLYAAYVDNPEQPEDQTMQEVICTVPDLISILDQNGDALGSQELRYGLKVRVIAMPSHPLWTDDERALRVGGPRGFGLDMKWKSIGEYKKPRSVIDDFDTNG